MIKNSYKQSNYVIWIFTILNHLKTSLEPRTPLEPKTSLEPKTPLEPYIIDPISTST